MNNLIQFETDEQVSHTQRAARNNVSLIRWLVEKKFAKTEQQASSILLVVAIVLISASVLFTLLRNSPERNVIDFNEQSIEEAYYQNVRIHTD